MGNPMAERQVTLTKQNERTDPMSRNIRPSMQMLREANLVPNFREQSFFGWRFTTDYYGRPYEFEVSRTEAGPVVTWTLAVGCWSAQRIIPRSMSVEEWEEQITRSILTAERLSVREIQDQRLVQIIEAMTLDESVPYELRAELKAAAAGSGRYNNMKLLVGEQARRA